MSRDPLPPINFGALSDALLARAGALVPAWLPGGVQRGHEYVCGGLSGGAGSSCAVNLQTGKWSDFASGDERGNDLVSLYAAIHGLSQQMGKAAMLVAREEGLEDVAGVQPARPGTKAPRPAPRPAPPPGAAKPKADAERWKTLMPVPATAPATTFWHFHRRNDRHQDPIDHVAEYRMDGQLLGYVVRFLDSSGDKETLPHTWCISERDGSCKWVWRTWDEPRPLYIPAQTMPEGRTVVLVEGEKKADRLHAVLEAQAPNVYHVVSWPGGCKAFKKALWDWLAGCTVLLWPDCDAKREPLSRAEAKAFADDAAGQLAKHVAQQAKPLLPAHKQPGMAAMLGIGALLRADHGCTVQLLPIPEPGAVVDGWDCADAINTDGWTGEQVLAFFGRAQPLPLPSGLDAAKGRPGKPAGGSGVGGGDEPPRDGPAEAGNGDDAFQDHLDFMCDSMDCKVHELGVTRKLLIAALRKAPALRECLGFNELTGVPSTRVAFPWRADPGPLIDSDDLAFGDWVSTVYKLKAASRAALSEAIDTVADQRRFHPVRDWLRGLTHDGKPRIDKWLIHVLGIDPASTPPKLLRYLELVGRYLLLGLVARVMTPGCKFDYSPVLEGKGGIGKSTFVKTLVGEEFFSDTHFDIGQGKDGMEQFVGVWAYELSELTALRRADSEQVKQFFSSQKDRFRGAYGRYVQDHKRQLVIFCSTNKKQYLYDTTGNRRFWPFWISQPVNLVWLEKYRELLFAEAFAMFSAGERFWPSLEEEDIYFVPEQDKRLVETSVQSRLYELLTREGAPSAGTATASLTVLTTFVTIDQLVMALGTDPGKASTLLEGQVRGWLEAQGWEYGRESTGQRRRGFRRPAVWPPKIIEDDDSGPLPAVDDVRQAQADNTGGRDDDPF